MNKIRAVIFDLGGVLINLNQDLTFRAFEKLGIDLLDIYQQSVLFSEYEKGIITDKQFRDGIRYYSQKPQLTDAQIDHAWNRMLLHFNKESFDLLKKLRSQFKVYLLSNTNSIHERAFIEEFQTTFPDKSWQDEFDTIFYSHQLGLSKPDSAIYTHVLAEIKCNSTECIFIDDSAANIASANKLGIHVILAQQTLSASMYSDILQIAGKSMQQ